MRQNNDDLEVSDLEREFEMEMEDEPSSEFESEEDAGSGEFEEPDSEFEGDYDSENGDYASRFYELSQRSFESESEADDEVNRLVNDMEHEFFFKGLGKRLRKAGKGLLSKAGKYAMSRIPQLKALQGITQLARGNLKGSLASLAKAGLASAIPGGAVALPALKALGFEASEPDGNREAWDNYVEVAREAFDALAENLNEQADNPLEASRIAATSFNTGLKRVQGRGIAGHRSGRRRRTRVIRVRAGERIVIEGV
jgi:hypothetical protein